MYTHTHTQWASSNKIKAIQRCFQKTVRHQHYEGEEGSPAWNVSNMNREDINKIVFHCGALTYWFLNTLTSFSYVCLPLYLVFRTGYRWLFIFWLPILPFGKYFLSKVVQVSILLNTLPVPVFGSGCELYKQSHLQTITDKAEPGSNGQWLHLTRPPGLEPPSDKSVSWLFPNFCIKNKDSIY